MRSEKEREESNFSPPSRESSKFIKQVPSCLMLTDEPDIKVLVVFPLLLNTYLSSRNFRYPWSVPEMKIGTFNGYQAQFYFEALERDDLKVSQLPENFRDQVLVNIMADLHLMITSQSGQQALSLFNGFEGELLEGYLGFRNPLYSFDYWGDFLGERGEVFIPLLLSGRGEKKFNHHLSSLKDEAKKAKIGLKVLATAIDHGDFQEKNIVLAAPYDPKTEKTPLIYILDWDGVRQNYAWASILWFLMTASNQSKVVADFNPKRAERILGLTIEEIRTRPVLREIWNPIPSPSLANFLLKVNSLRAAYTSYLRAVFGDYAKEEKEKLWDLFDLNLSILDFGEKEGENFFRSLYRKISSLRLHAEIKEPIAFDIFTEDKSLVFQPPHSSTSLQV
jgi:hypothetical protein